MGIVLVMVGDEKSVSSSHRVSAVTGFLGVVVGWLLRKRRERTRQIRAGGEVLFHLSVRNRPGVTHSLRIGGR